MRIDLRYVSSFSYDGPVAQSHNVLRARPAEDRYQRTVSYQVDVDPPASVRSSVDYWGTWVDTFAVVREHTRLTVAAEAVVDTSPRPEPESDAHAPEHLLAFHEYLVPSPHVSWDPDVAEFARAAIAGRDGYVDQVHGIVEAVGKHLDYTPGSTEVGTSVEEIFATGEGVCQDYAHLALAAFRSLGIPARYVSGYLYAVDSSLGDEPVDDEISVSTHAWIEVPVDDIWWALDPTNQLPVGERHVKIGHGRDYEDVTPLRGVFHGSSTNAGLEASVSMSRSDLPQFDLAPRPELLPVRQSQQ